MVTRSVYLLALATQLLVFALSSATHAQIVPSYTDVRLENMPYENSSGERAVTHLFYGRDGKLRRALWTLRDGSRYSSNFHLYDPDGCEIEKYREFSDGLTSTETYGCDANQRRTVERFQRSDGVKGSAQFVWTENGRLSSLECDSYKGWFNGRIVYSYDEQGRRNGGTIHRDGKPVGTIAYAHDGKGHLIREHWDFGGQWSQTLHYEYEPRPAVSYAYSSPYLSMNPAFRVVKEDYDFNAESGGPSHYTYDEKGRLTRKVFERSDGVRTTTTYLYDDAGDLVSSHRVYQDGRTAEFQYEFDTAGRMTNRSFQRSDGESGHERYAYDRLGRLETAVYTNVDFWLNGTIAFRHDGRGFLASGKFTGENGFDAEIQFETDADGNVLKMRWAFGFGKTQTYTFQYEPISR